MTRLQAMNVLFKGAHHILHKVDEVSAPAGVLPRSPLFDREVVELAFALPPELKLRGSVEKYLLKQAVADLLPPKIVERPKSGMLVPVEGWFRGQLLPHARARLLDGLAPYHLFDRSWLEQLLAGRLGGLHPRHGAKISAPRHARGLAAPGLRLGLARGLEATRGCSHERHDSEPRCSRW